jgi:hypothetical protein
MRERAGAPLTVRVCNIAPEPAVASIAVDGRPALLEVVDLTGRVVAHGTGSFDLRAWEIVTLRVTER